MDGNEQDLKFVLGVLSAFEGQACIYELVRSIVAVLDTGSQLLNEAWAVLSASGLVVGEFGRVELHAERKAWLEPWLSDPSENVRVFAVEKIRELDRQIAAEIRSAEASIAMRKLNHNEELDGDGM